MNRKKSSGESIINLPAKIIIACAGLIAGFFICRIFIVPLTVSDSSMEPSLVKGQKVLLSRFGGLREGDIVLAEHPLDKGKFMFKRIIASAGDTVEIRNKVLYINGEKAGSKNQIFKDSRNLPLTFTNRDTMIPLRLEKKQFFLMGDNADRSYDSRELGPFAANMIKGRVFHIFNKK